MPYMTEEEIDALNETDLSRDTPFAICNVTHTIFSVARYYGGATFNGSRYTYMAWPDELIRDDVLEWLKNRRKSAEKEKKAKKKEGQEQQGVLFKS